MHPVDAAQRLSKTCDALSFGPPVAWTYNPLDYAWDGHRQYAERFGGAPKPALFVGMNPGPWGMGQTGVPFGDPEMVRAMGITRIMVKQPGNARRERPVHGLDAPRGEVSGSRLYGGIAEAFGSLPKAYERLYVANYCPLLFFGEGGVNLTPDKLRREDQGPLFEACDAHLAALLDHFRPRTVVGIGKFAEGRARRVLDATGADARLMGLLHPSPASPLANKEGGAYWRRQLVHVLRDAGVLPEQPS